MHQPKKFQWQSVICSCALLLFFCGTCIPGISLASPGTRIDYLGNNPLTGGKPSRDTLHNINIFNRLEWTVSIKHKNAIRQVITTRPDSINFNKPDTVLLTAAFIVGPQLVNHISAMHYHLEGSVLIRLNGQPILASGIFAPDKTSKLSHTSQNDYTNFIFADSAAQIDITYVPDEADKRFDLGLQLLPPAYANSNKEAHIKDGYTSFALGFYYLAFGIIFLLLFAFFKEKSENLYFALFCLFGAIAFLWDSFGFTLLSNGQEWFWTVLALEFLSIFFARMLRNKDKSKIPLIIVLVIFACSFLPAIKDGNIPLNGQQVPLLQIVLQSILICYAGITSLYFLIRGFGQKRWEARAIVYIFSSAFVLFYIFPFITMMVVAINNPKKANVISTNLDYLTDVGLCIFPLSAAIVLGRRNGQNQKQLLRQIASIEKLSEENLATEKEKKQILEGLNTELERKVQERTVEVMRQKEIIEEKNKAITDNLTYAQRIQSAILPDIQLIYKTLEDSFILYLPKDIVSGDFYAFSERNGRVLIIAGDCTGHGVSGAFMSMIGGSLLNQIINERGTEDPAGILTQLNSLVIETFRQSENDSNDGMDISICSFDLAARHLQYAGANRPLWLIRDKEIQVVKPDKFPIGGLQSAADRRFTNHALQLQPGDSIYLFTDGYADQFGGPNGKKMMTSQFKTVLLSIQHLSMRQQEAHLKTFFDTWKAANEQVDDVLVIGVRV